MEEETTEKEEKTEPESTEKEEVEEAKDILDVVKTPEPEKEIIETLLTREPSSEKDLIEEASLAIEDIEEGEKDISITDEFEMEVIDTEEDILQIPTPPPKESSVESDLLLQSTDAHFVLPGIEQITQMELEDIESLDVDEHIIASFIDRAISSTASGIEVVFSDLLSLQNNPLLIDKIYHMVMKKLVKLQTVNPEVRIADMMTYLSAHKPDYYTSKFEKLLEDTINTKEEKEFYTNLRTAALIVKSSLLIAGDVIEEFLRKYITTEDVFFINKLRRLVTVFALTDPNLLQLMCKILAKIYGLELDKEEPNDYVIDRSFAFLTMFDGISVGLSLIMNDSDKILASFLEKLDKMQFNASYKQIVSKIILEYQEGSYENLILSLNGREIPDTIEYEMTKRKYTDSLSKVGSIPLEIFAERIGHPIDKTEKIIYDMILKEEIPARIELLNGRLYIVQEQEEVEVTEEIKEEEDTAIEDEPKDDKLEEEKEEPTPVTETEEVELDFKCSICDRSFKTERGLKVHTRRSHQEE